ncbi:MAG: CoB--CoM heterodisulfide reductase iron-sulfur subunit B family protein [Desulfarculaceae bacterium]|nr:CoB--CoM heterodisulfide reductase iron-sulfur subunit B family protein [Desulfarculaceae bacterium]MCF8102118.1 CoB--CoM heterodisulfide reductase iron-sulfur subunit B family protein [Desulfarculaceae bacterium]MCF8118337.1 CoB--CoM heterodisulfide reductase iron-sulfur subunit B family protein [Desulfarculaceae bacterium]
MTYFIYPGCSLEAGGSHYEVSVEAVFKALDVEIKEIEDWNCCGASIHYVGGTELQTKTLNARNLALAEKQGGYDIIAPCSSCYIQMVKTAHEFDEEPELAAELNQILGEGGLSYSGGLKVRHVLDVLYNDVGIEGIKAAVKKPLTGLKVAPYYGCQTTRPYGEYDSMEEPTSMDEILAALGAEVVPFDKKVKCCGSGIFFTEMETCAPLVGDIIGAAQDGGADLISVPCPMCQMNLEIYQPRLEKMLKTDLSMPVVFVTQLMALAFGMDPSKDAALNRNIVSADEVLRHVAA